MDRCREVGLGGASETDFFFKFAGVGPEVTS